mmetsp:Transcript_37180/g.93316  ORF Transcript_37180/g.93316 Transcript_37180/m.93316 type:complete len:206 (-) Transcript_37180:1320-1937(-)
MVGRLVQQQDVGVLEQQLPQSNPHLPPAREALDQLVHIVVGEAHHADHLCHLGVHLVRLEGLGLLLQLGQLLQKGVHRRDVARLAQLRDAVLHLSDVVEYLQLLVEHRHELLLERPAVHQILYELLTQKRHPKVGGRLDHLSTHCFQLASDDLELSGLAAAVGADQADAVARADLPRGVLEDLLVPERDADLVEADRDLVGLLRV